MSMRDEFVWPSDADRAESDELNRVCEYLEGVLDDRDRLLKSLSEMDDLFAAQREAPSMSRIASSKVRQLGGDVCGVLVRKDGRLAAVDEHGRVQWLQSGQGVEPSGVWQFYQNGEWHTGMNINNHRKNTEAAGFPTRDLYTHHQPAQSWQDVEPVAFGIFYEGVFQEHAWNRDAAEAIALEDYTGLDGVTVEPIYTHPHASQSKPWAWCFTDVNGKPKEFCESPKQAHPQDMRIRTPLYTHAQPAQQGSVPHWKELEALADEYVEGYEFRGDEGDYQPNERERFLIQDCVAGLMDEVHQMLKRATPQPEGDGRIDHQCELCGHKWSSNDLMDDCMVCTKRPQPPKEGA